MGIGQTIRRLLTKDKVNPERDREPYYAYDNPWGYGHPYRLVDDDPPYYVDNQGKRHYVTDYRERYRFDHRGRYYVDDQGERHYVWSPPWSENPS